MRHYVVHGAIAASLALGGCVSAMPIAQVELVDALLAEQGLAEQGLAEQGLAEQGLAEQGLAEQGLAEQGLAEQGLAEQAASAEHVGGLGLSYGTAILSRRALSDPGVHTFEQSSATPPKGFSVSTVELDGQWVDVASVHLDFASDTNRYKQIKQLVDVVSRRDRPIVLMGDFNTGWSAWPFRYLTEQLGLSAYRPDAENLATFGSLDRLDWGLVPPALEFARYEVPHDVVSDHKGVVVDVRFKDGDADNPMLADAELADAKEVE